MPPGWVWTPSGPRAEGAASPENCATFGVGLPISRLYARFSGGDVELRNFGAGEVNASSEAKAAADSGGEPGLEACVTWGEIGSTIGATL